MKTVYSENERKEEKEERQREREIKGAVKCRSKPVQAANDGIEEQQRLIAGGGFSCVKSIIADGQKAE